MINVIVGRLAMPYHDVFDFMWYKKSSMYIDPFQFCLFLEWNPTCLIVAANLLSALPLFFSKVIMEYHFFKKTWLDSFLDQQLWTMCSYLQLWVKRCMKQYGKIIETKVLGSFIDFKQYGLEIAELRPRCKIIHIVIF